MISLGKLRRHRWIASMTVIAVTIVALPALLSFPAKLVWNASASVPTGLYSIAPAGQLHTGDLVLVEPPPRLAAFLAERGYLAPGVPLLKHVAALPGATVCRFGHAITIDGEVRAIARARDRLNRPLPRWSGCRVLPGDQVFLLNEREPDSLDGRYFGPLPLGTITGQATPVWTDQE